MIETTTACARRRDGGVTASVDTERRRLAREIHDGSMPYLTAAICSTEAIVHELREMHVDCADRLSQVSVQLQHVAAELRQTVKCRVTDMRGGLESELSGFLKVVVEPQGLSSTLNFDDSISLDEVTTFQVFRIVQEASQNAMKHAGANVLSVSVAHHESDVVVSVIDDGRGIDAEANRGVGIDSMYHRATLLRGCLQIDRNANGGTAVVLRFPLKSPKP